MIGQGRPFVLLLILPLILQLPTGSCSLLSSSSSSSSSSGTSFHKSQQQQQQSLKVPLVSPRQESSCSSDNDTQVSKTQKQLQRLKLIQVQIIHRHGDRTPITPMKDRDYWKGTLPSPELLSKISSGTRIIIRRSDDKNDMNNDDNDNNDTVSHAAGGIGPFGKLTKLGLLQMVQLGSQIRDELHLDQDQDNNHLVDEHGNLHINCARLFTDTDPIHPSKVKIKSTNFPRTIQSVQALLMGLFPLGYDGEIEIDASETDVLIPDPQPRLSVEQVELERELSRRSHIVEREQELQNLAGKITDSLYHLIDWEHASGNSWGIGEEKHYSEKDRDRLTFSQLAEVMTCLRVRDMLPESISHDDYKTIASHSAWKWFENLRNGNLARLAMKSFMNLIMETLRDGIEENNEDPVLYIYSCHDSSLIGLMCAFRLEQPAVWPEYGSYLKVELFKSQDQDGKGDGATGEVNYYVRFSLNGQVLKSSWGVMEQDGSKSDNSNQEEPREMICLKHLSRSIAKEHGHSCIMKEKQEK